VERGPVLLLRQLDQFPKVAAVVEKAGNFYFFLAGVQRGSRARDHKAIAALRRRPKETEDAARRRRLLGSCSTKAAKDAEARPSRGEAFGRKIEKEDGRGVLLLL